jgi:hypothetical protein
MVLSNFRMADHPDTIPATLLENGRFVAKSARLYLGAAAGLERGGGPIRNCRRSLVFESLWLALARVAQSG